MNKAERLVARRRLNVLGYKALSGRRTPEEDAEANKIMIELEGLGWRERIKSAKEY